MSNEFFSALESDFKIVLEQVGMFSTRRRTELLDVMRQFTDVLRDDVLRDRFARLRAITILVKELR